MYKEIENKFYFMLVNTSRSKWEKKKKNNYSKSGRGVYWSRHVNSLQFNSLRKSDCRIRICGVGVYDLQLLARCRKLAFKWTVRTRCVTSLGVTRFPRKPVGTRNYSNGIKITHATFCAFLSPFPSCPPEPRIGSRRTKYNDRARFRETNGNRTGWFFEPDISECIPFLRCTYDARCCAWWRYFFVLYFKRRILKRFRYTLAGYTFETASKNKAWLHPINTCLTPIIIQCRIRRF